LVLLETENFVRDEHSCCKNGRERKLREVFAALYYLAD
jgi:hypothetical protein